MTNEQTRKQQTHDLLAKIADLDPDDKTSVVDDLDYWALSRIDEAQDTNTVVDPIDPIAHEYLWAIERSGMASERKPSLISRELARIAANLDLLTSETDPSVQIGVDSMVRAVRSVPRYLRPDALELPPETPYVSSAFYDDLRAKLTDKLATIRQNTAPDKIGEAQRKFAQQDIYREYVAMYLPSRKAASKYRGNDKLDAIGRVNTFASTLRELIMSVKPANITTMSAFLRDMYTTTSGKPEDKKEWEAMLDGISGELASYLVFESATDKRGRKLFGVEASTAKQDITEGYDIKLVTAASRHPILIDIKSNSAYQELAKKEDYVHLEEGKYGVKTQNGKQILVIDVDTCGYNGNRKQGAANLSIPYPSELLKAVHAYIHRIDT